MENVTLNGFEVFNDFTPGFETKKEEPKVDSTDTVIEGATEELTDEELEKLKEPTKKTTKKEPEKNDDDDNNDDDTNIVDDPSSITNNSDDDNDNNAIIGFFDSLSEELGWEEIEEDQKPKTAEELVDYFREVIKENSVPSYANEEVAALDEFVRNGGNIKDYLSISASLDLDNIDTEDENNQKAIIREFLKEKGFNQKQIEKKLSKYEDAGLLEDEAEDALEALRDIREEKKQELLKNQEKAAVEALKRQQAYFESVANEIKGMDNIRGIRIPEKDKRPLLEYIFKVNSDGMTKFQKDWSSNVRNLLESAYFMMKGDELLKSALIKGSNAAINKFKQSLNNNVSRKTRKQETTSDDTMWDSFVNRIRTK